MATNMSITHDSPPAIKDTIKEDSDESVNSPPGSAHGHPAPATDAPRRKGGRKPIYATVEERKQRNRQAQAAFRERRTEYIKQLEEENKRLNATCNELRNINMVLSDDFMMCRYKNSFLERILVEHAIDIETELRVKGWDEQTQMPQLQQDVFPQPLQAQLPMQHQHQQSFIRRSHSRRSSSGMTARQTPAPLAPTQPPSGSPEDPPITSPSITSPTIVAESHFLPRRSMMGHSSVMHGVMGGMYASSAYQSNMRQLDQDYDDHVSMMGVTIGPPTTQQTTMSPSPPRSHDMNQPGDILAPMPDLGNIGFQQQFADWDSSLQFPQVQHGYYMNQGGTS